MLKRIFDIIMSFFGLILLAPLFLFIAIWIKTDSHGSIFYRQTRVGLNGINFKIFKFRTMYQDVDKQGCSLTVGNDVRITQSGKFLRRYKFDELAQLINVFFGTMSLVGPRPEVPEYMRHYSPESRTKILSIRPGITDLASLEFKDENTILGQSDDYHQTYISQIMPIKEKYYLDYVAHHNIFLDLKIIGKTLIEIW